tara:strand:- start:248 stop:724 length:477 start_codon:yes stop_codon:yes gene_type:complete
MIKEKRDEKGGLYYDHSTIYKKEPDPFDSVKQFDNIKMKNEDLRAARKAFAERAFSGPIQCGLQGELYYGDASQGEPYHTIAPNFPVAKEKVNHPQHYNAGKIEVIDAICDWELDFIEGNVVKYVTRAKHKGDELGDLKKARWYLDYLVKRLEKQNAT